MVLWFKSAQIVAVYCRFTKGLYWSKMLDLIQNKPVENLPEIDMSKLTIL